MLHSLSRNIAVFLFDDNDKFPLEVYIYGIEICLSSLIGIIAILIISFMIGRFFEGIPVSYTHLTLPTTSRV